MLTAASYGPVEAFCFVAPTDCGLGLFARTGLGAGQVVTEYGGPRLPAKMHRGGEYVLQVPNTSTVVDGLCENSPFRVPPHAAVFANHSAVPNARLEQWPNAAPDEPRSHMMLVAIEPVEAGAEIRINYEDGKLTSAR
jgi:hypothetical protein